MVGNPFPVSAAVSGADALYVYSTDSAAYKEAVVLGYGQGAWAYSDNGGTLIFTPAGS